MNPTSWCRGLSVEVGGSGVVSHTGSAAVRLLADRVGLTAGLSKALSRPGFTPVHDRGGVLRDLAVMLADGGTTISEIATLRDQGELFGPVASMPTAWRALQEMTPAALARVAAARAKARRQVWKLIADRHGAVPGVKIADRSLQGVVGIRLDASIVIAHSDKANAAPTFKRTFGHHPLTAWCDNTGESLVLALRPGNAGSNTASDHIDVLDQAIAQIPAAHRRRLLITVDGAGASHALVNHLHTLNARPGHQVIYSVGFDLDERARTALATMPDTGWDTAIDADGHPRIGPDENGRDQVKAQVAEITGLLRRSAGGDRFAGWPADLRLFTRREKPHPGAQLSLFEQHEGWRYQIIATNLPADTAGWRGQPAYIDAGHRAQARVEDRIRCAKATGMRRMASRDYQINTAWCAAVSTGCDLLTWFRLLALDGHLARAEPKTLRYRLLHVAARIIRGGRKRRIRIPETWPWATDLQAAFGRILALPPP